MANNNPVFLKRYDECLENIRFCRTSELWMLNFSITIFGAVVWFIFTQNLEEPKKFFISLFLAVILALIGLFVARLNEVERLFFIIIKKYYIDNDVTYYEYPVRLDYNRNILFIIYLFLIFVALYIGSIYTENIFLYKIIVFRIYFLYVIFFGEIMLISSKEIHAKIKPEIKFPPKKKIPEKSKRRR